MRDANRRICGERTKVRDSLILRLATKQTSRNIASEADAERKSINILRQLQRSRIHQGRSILIGQIIEVIGTLAQIGHETEIEIPSAQCQTQTGGSGMVVPIIAQGARSGWCKDKTARHTPPGY